MREIDVADNKTESKQSRQDSLVSTGSCPSFQENQKSEKLSFGSLREPKPDTSQMQRIGSFETK